MAKSLFLLRFNVNFCVDNGCIRQAVIFMDVGNETHLWLSTCEVQSSYHYNISKNKKHILRYKPQVCAKSFISSLILLTIVSTDLDQNLKKNYIKFIDTKKLLFKTYAYIM